MKYLFAISLGLASASASPTTLQKRADPQGIDVSDYQTDIDWSSVASSGVTFAYIKATEGTGYTSPQFSGQYEGASNAGIIRGAYHFAHPDESDGATQASYFVSNGGGWTADGITLPGALDIEYNPSGAECYGLSAADMVTWVMDFSNTYQSSTGRYPVIYTTTDWWTTCTGNSATFAANSPLWLADYASSVGTLPAGWEYETFWQYADSGSNPGDQDYFNGDAAGLKAIASG
ncbi:glycoside hydrolase family 25 protein [Coniophora puteana RWD-64-598 SS2]|uniref:N,O-diacetylmuramidase n=1 Tax=Coniophora puteana (strain RWD-64-598) TaxID=741705 RepID=A0A5M3MKE8_CONPW|nr:glycoside hydrolase family 25 protein [Coniophora puteana RWD-64-598 SS2]EIW79294.1 glycoside hydrolase family 25 protein [Coniophora puteana RWD-64-598 SS2]